MLLRQVKMVKAMAALLRCSSSMRLHLAGLLLLACSWRRLQSGSFFREVVQTQGHIRLRAAQQPRLEQSHPALARAPSQVSSMLHPCWPAAEHHNITHYYSQCSISVP